MVIGPLTLCVKRKGQNPLPDGRPLERPQPPSLDVLVRHTSFGIGWAGEREVEGLESVQALAWERAGLSVDDETREFSTLSSHRYLSTMWIMSLNQMI